MPKSVVLDVFHVTLSISSTLPTKQAQAARRILGQPTFSLRVKRSVQQVLDRYRALDSVAIKISR